MGPPCSCAGRPHPLYLHAALQLPVQPPHGAHGAAGSLALDTLQATSRVRIVDLFARDWVQQDSRLVGVLPVPVLVLGNLPGLELLATCGVYCIDTHRVIKYTEEEILASVTAAPKTAQFGEPGVNGRTIACRKHDDKRPPIIQGGPTGAPCSEDLFLKIHQSYAQEPIVDTIVDGVMQTIKGKDPTPGTPWEIAAVKAEAKAVREAQMRAGRCGMGL